MKKLINIFWFVIWLLVIVIQTWVLNGSYQLEDPIARGVFWIYLAGILIFMIPAGIYAIRDLRK